MSRGHNGPRLLRGCRRLSFRAVPEARSLDERMASLAPIIEIQTFEIFEISGDQNSRAAISRLFHHPGPLQAYSGSVPKPFDFGTLQFTVDPVNE
jgi:hypothetical protein